MAHDSKNPRNAGAIARSPIAPLRVANNPHAVFPGPFGILLTWLERYRQRRTVYGLSDHMLKDIGVSRADVERESSKQFWRE